MRALITGCDTGLGKILYEELTKQGSFILPHFKNEPHQNSIIGDINDEITRDFISLQLNKYNIDTFINNAAIYKHDNFLSHTDDEIKKMLETNLISPILLTKKICQWFQQRGDGLIININSIACKNPGAKETIYTASKTGLEGFSKSLQIEFIGTKIKVIDIYLGAMKTPMSQWRQNFEELIDPHEVADLIINVASAKYRALIPTEITIRRR